MVRLGAVSYLNVRPLVYGLDRRQDLFSLRYDVPSVCAQLLATGDIDLGMIPSIEVQRGPEPYRIVPDLGIVSDGAVASVALFSRVPLPEIRRIGLDTSSRTSAGLVRILCREAWCIEPSFEAVAPDIATRVLGCDAALVIGDPALFLDHTAAGLMKVDLGEEWTRMTGLPFVWAVWAGRPDALSRDHVAALQQARDQGIAHAEAIADAYCGPARAAVCRAYLRDNMKYRLSGRESAGLRMYHELAARHGVIDRAHAVEFY
jgi:chorismate dehydratase